MRRSASDRAATERNFRLHLWCGRKGPKNRFRKYKSMSCGSPHCNICHQPPPLNRREARSDQSLRGDQ